MFLHLPIFVSQPAGLKHRPFQVAVINISQAIVNINVNVVSHIIEMAWAQLT